MLCVIVFMCDLVVRVLCMCCVYAACVLLVAVAVEIHGTRPPALTCKTVCREFPRLCFFCKRRQSRNDSAAAAAAAATRRADQWRQRIKLSIDQLLQRVKGGIPLTRLRLTAFLRAFPADIMTAAYQLLQIGLCAVCGFMCAVC